MAAIKNDGTVPYGSVVLTINAVTYVAESFNVTRPTTKIERLNELNEPNGKVTIANFVTGTAVLQLATTSTVIPAAGQEFSLTLDSAIGSETFYVTDREQPLSQGEAKKCSITFDKKYN